MLFGAGLIPIVMTFEGRNFDIFAGITAPIASLLAFRGGKVNRTLLGVWNLASLCLLINIVSTAGLNRPAVLMTMPFVWLPAFIVPVVFASHLFVLCRWWRGTL